MKIDSNEPSLRTSAWSPAHASTVKQFGCKASARLRRNLPQSRNMNDVGVSAVVLVMAMLGALGCSSGTSGSSDGTGQGQDAGLAVSNGSKLSSADPDAEFLRSICVRSLQGTTEIPPDEQQAFCDCVRDQVSPQLTAKHRESLHEARGYLALERAPPDNLFERSGLRPLVVESQDVCANQLWEVAPAISAEDHERFAQLANRSVEEFDSMLSSACPDGTPLAERKSCLKVAAQSWMENHSAEYEAVPDYYITANDLAKEFLAN